MKEMKNNLPKAENNPVNHVNPVKFQNTNQHVDKTDDPPISVKVTVIFGK
jgi:hypothetical protein